MCTAVHIDHMTYDGDSCYETCVYDNVHLDVNLYIHMYTYINDMPYDYETCVYDNVQLDVNLYIQICMYACINT